MKKFSIKSFIAGMLLMTVFMGTTVFAESITKTIQVTTGTIKKILLNGNDVTPSTDKQPFVYNGTTYVPLRYISENFYKNVQWDGKTGTITIGGVNISQAEHDAIFQAFDLDMKHMADKDLNGYIGDLSSQIHASILNSTEATVKYVFDNYDLKYNIISKDIVSYDGNTCELRVVCETRKVGGNLPFTDNRTTQLHKLIKENGKWKFLYSVIEDQEVLQ